MPRSGLPKALTERLGRGRRPEAWFLGSLQSQALSVLSRRGPSTVREVVNGLPARDRPAYTTVMTVLLKLHEKGLTRRTKDGRGFVYEALYTPEELRDRMAQHLVHRLVDDFGDVALAHFAEALRSRDRRQSEKLRRPG